MTSSNSSAFPETRSNSTEVALTNVRVGQHSAPRDSWALNRALSAVRELERALTRARTDYPTVINALEYNAFCRLAIQNYVAVMGHPDIEDALGTVAVDHREPVTAGADL